MRVGRAASPFAAVCMDGLRNRNRTAILPHPFGAAGRGLPALPRHGHTISETAPMIGKNVPNGWETFLGNKWQQEFNAKNAKNLDAKNAKGNPL